MRIHLDLYYTVTGSGGGCGGGGGALEIVAVLPEAVDGVVMNCKVHRLSQSYDSSVVSASGLADSARLSILDSFVLHLLISQVFWSTRILPSSTVSGAIYPLLFGTFFSSSPQHHLHLPSRPTVSI